MNDVEAKVNRNSLIDDLLESRHDLMSLAKAHGLSVDELADWANEPRNQRMLLGLCVLADLQTQVLLGRYRTQAVSRLFQFALGPHDKDGHPIEETDKDRDIARRACVELLKLDLKPRELMNMATHDDEPDDADGNVRQLLYRLVADADDAGDDAGDCGDDGDTDGACNSDTAPDRNNAAVESDERGGK